jgi:mRNA interferase HigB
VVMRIISEKTLKIFVARHAKAESAIKEWIKKVREARWETFADVKRTFNSADVVTISKTGGRRTVVVYNVAGNDYRIIASNNYQTGIVYILFTLTHAEYSAEKWKSKL